MPQVIRSKYDLKAVIKNIKSKRASIGLVPTMGALHQGHLQLVETANQHYDVTIATIFVNPTQFNNKADLKKYPKTEEADIEKLSATGCDVIFIPEVKEIYQKEVTIGLNFGYLEEILEGKHRPGHFNGVGLIVMKLFGLVEPTGAFFGQKDLQQFRIVSTLIADFDLPIKLHLVPIIRETSGLAMSSRNRRLNDAELKIATTIYSALHLAKAQLIEGYTQEMVLDNVERVFREENGIELEYFEIVDEETLLSKTKVSEGDRLALCVAAFVAGVRLIDNIIFEYKECKYR